MLAQYDLGNFNKRITILLDEEVLPWPRIGIIKEINEAREDKINEDKTNESVKRFIANSQVKKDTQNLFILKLSDGSFDGVSFSRVICDDHSDWNRDNKSYGGCRVCDAYDLGNFGSGIGILLDDRQTVEAKARVLTEIGQAATQKQLAKLMEVTRAVPPRPPLYPTTGLSSGSVMAAGCHPRRARGTVIASPEVGEKWKDTSAGGGSKDTSTGGSGQFNVDDSPRRPNKRAKKEKKKKGATKNQGMVEANEMASPAGLGL